MIKRGGVWICPEGYVPPGRMADPETTDFWVSWQDDAALEDDVVSGGDAAVEWGRQRSDVVMIRLGHHEGSYFSAGQSQPADGERVPHWPPGGPPPDGWWSPPPAPTPEDVARMADRVDCGELDAAAAAGWAREQLIIFEMDLEMPTGRALFELQERLGC